MSSRLNTNEHQTGMRQSDYEKTYKILVIGDSSTGKTQLVSRFCHGQVSESAKPTVLMEHSTKLLHEKRILAQFWDMAGREMFK